MRALIEAGQSQSVGLSSPYVHAFACRGSKSELARGIIVKTAGRQRFVWGDSRHFRRVLSGWSPTRKLLFGTEHLRAWNAVFAEGRKRGNAAYFGPALVEMEIADVDKRSQWAYDAFCEIWEVQGRAKCRPFFRAVFDWGINPMLSIREGCFRHGLELREKRTGQGTSQGLSTICGHLKREMGKLRAKWNTKLEIAARDNDYQQQRIRTRELQRARTPTSLVPTSAPIDVRRPSETVAGEENPQSHSKTLTSEQGGAAALNFHWKELEIRFRDIQARPSAQQRVSAEFTRTVWASGSTTEEWRTRGNSVCRVEFERLASIAARKLGYLPSEGAGDHWLDLVREWVQETGMDKDATVAWCPDGSGFESGLAYTTKTLWTERIAELSAMFCMELMARGTPELAISPTSERSGIAIGQLEPRKGTRKVHKTKTELVSELHRKGVIFGAIQAGQTGKEYCAALDARKIRLPNRWKEDGSPATYSLAYKDKVLRKRIQDEKCRYRVQFERTSAPERERIIQGELSTRRTRL